MELELKFDHTKRLFSESIGISTERSDEIIKLYKTVMNDDSIQTESGAIEWTLSQLKDVEQNDLIFIGHCFG